MSTPSAMIANRFPMLRRQSANDIIDYTYGCMLVFIDESSDPGMKQAGSSSRHFSSPLQS